MKQLGRLSSVSQKEKATNSRSLEVQAARAAFQPGAQLQFEIVGQALRLPAANDLAVAALALQNWGQKLLRLHGAAPLANEMHVKWNPRLKTCAGRADYRARLISLNPRLRDHPGEVERTFLHELAHLLAQFRAGKRRILPHGDEWRQACVDLGIGDEKRCHDLPFAGIERIRRLLYKCPNCLREFQRVRRIRRVLACLACCRAHNRGEFDPRFRLQLCSGGL